MEKKRNEKILSVFLHVLADCFLTVMLMLNRKDIPAPDLVMCLSFIAAGSVSCILPLFFRFPGELFGSVIQTAAFLVCGRCAGSFAPLFFIPFFITGFFITGTGHIRKWGLVAGGALGTYVLFVLYPHGTSGAWGGADELVFSCILSSVFTAILAEYRLRNTEKTMRSMMHEKEYLALQTDELADRSCRDGLTGLPNRRYYDTVLPKLIGANEEFGTPLSLIVIDIDFFKKINDTYGHATGDGVLSALGSLISSNIRPDDIACRYGGEEFVVLMKADATAAAGRAELLRSRAADLDISGVRITISCGVAQYVKDSDLFSIADGELYRAKELGRNRVCLHGKEREGEEK